MFFDSGTLIPALLLIIFFWGLGPLLPKAATWARSLVVLVVVVISLRYLVWRLTDTLLPLDQETVGWVGYGWTWLYYVAECAIFFEGTIFLLLMTRTKDRKEEANEHEGWLRSIPRDQWPTVDVFIPTYSEGIDVLEKTIIGAKHLDYPQDRFSVWVLDDSRRDWLRDYCATQGVGYLRRDSNAGAKAGNMNNALGQTSGDVIAILDADFVPQTHFLTRTVGFFREPTTGCVQTPHTFFNTDPLLMNLKIHQAYADDQKHFFEDVMTSRDAWGVAFSCGSCGLFRREALIAIDGFPTGSLTEDILSSISLLGKDYKTVYLSERQARGLAAEGLLAFFVQRARWARGGIQLLFVPEGPVRATHLTLLQRLFFLPAHWIVTYLGMLFMMIAPSFFLWFELVPIHFITLNELARYQLPVFVAAFMSNGWLLKNKRHPLISIPFIVFLAMRLAPTILHSMVKPFGATFRVTPKGAEVKGFEGDRLVVATAWAIIFFTLFGVVLNFVPETQIVSDVTFLAPSLIWGCFTIFVMLVVVLMAFEHPRHRVEERFTIERDVLVTLPDQSTVTARLHDLSMEGGRLGIQGVNVGQVIRVQIPEIGELSLRVVRQVGEGVGTSLEPLDPAQRELLIRYLFTGPFNNLGMATDGEVMSAPVGLAKRLLGPSPA